MRTDQRVPKHPNNVIPGFPAQPDGNELLDGSGGVQVSKGLFRLGHLQLARGDVGGASVAWVSEVGGLRVSSSTRPLTPRFKQLLYCQKLRYQHERVGGHLVGTGFENIRLAAFLVQEHPDPLTPFMVVNVLRSSF